MGFDVHYLLYITVEYLDNYEEYCKSNKHSDCEKHKLDIKHSEIINICSFFMFDNDDKSRLLKAARAYRKWEKRTGYEKDISRRMIISFTDYILDI